MLVLTLRKRVDSIVHRWQGYDDANLCFGPLLGYWSHHTAVDLHEMSVTCRYSASDDLKPQSMQVEAKA